MATVVSELRDALPIAPVDRPGDAAARAAALAGLPWSAFVLVATLANRETVTEAIRVGLEQSGRADQVGLSMDVVYWMTVVVAPLSELFVFLVAATLLAIGIDYVGRLSLPVVVGTAVVAGVADGAITNLTVPTAVVYAGKVATWTAFAVVFLAIYERDG